MKNQLRQARPSLRLASPLTFWICVGFAVVNIFLAIVIFTQPDTSHLALYFSIFTPRFYGSLFLLQVIIISISLLMNSWKYTRLALGMGLFIKAFYAYSLIELGLRTGLIHSLAITSLWLFITWVQFCTIVYFAVPFIHAKDARNERKY